MKAVFEPIDRVCGILASRVAYHSKERLGGVVRPPALLLNHHPIRKVAFVSNLVLIEQAVKESSYDRNYIGYLARKGFIKAEKHGGVWLVDLDSLKEYEARMQDEGTKKYDPTKYKDR